MDILAFNFEWMSFNTLLASLGVFLGIAFFYVKNKFLKWTLFLLWILFLPNTIYLVTDVQHFTRQWDKLTLSYQTLLAAQYLVLVFIGVFTFLISLSLLDKFLSQSKIKKNKALINIILVIINYLVAFGVGLGRIERVHSHEALINLLKVLTSINNLLMSQEAMLTIFLFGTFSNLLYFFFRDKFKIKAKK